MDGEFKEHRSNFLKHTPDVALDELHLQYEDWLLKQSEEIQSSPEYYEEKKDRLEEGLDFYLGNADLVQEQLIELNTAAAMRLIIAEALLVRTDQNKKIKTPEDIAATISKTMEIMLGKQLVLSIDSTQANDFLNLVKDTQNNPGRESSRNLREAIENWVLSLPIKNYSASKDKVNLFRQSRKEQTNAVNEYQSSLINLKDALNVESLHASDEKNEEIQELKKIIHKRLAQVESFRGGIIKKLPKQHPKLTNLGATLDTFLIDDIPDLTINYRNFSGKDHPAISQVKSMAGELWKMVDTCHNRDHYHHDMPGVRIHENGIKSWKRAIRKLFKEKGGNWDKMTDLSRINPIFSNAESMYFYNRAVQQLSHGLGWENFTRGRDRQTGKYMSGDKGARIVYSGTMNWNSCFKRTGKKLYAESKLDTVSISRSEPFAHPLYELAREVYEGERKLDDSLSDNTAFLHTLSHKIVDTMETLTLHKEALGSDITKRLETIKTFGEELKKNPDLLGMLHEKIVDTETIIRFSSVSNESSPSMAAMYAMQFDRLLNKMDFKMEYAGNMEALALQQASKSTERAASTKHLDDKNELLKDVDEYKKSAKTWKNQASETEKRKNRLAELYEEYGPKLGTHYTEYDLKLVEKMQAEYEARMKITVDTIRGR